MNEIFPNSKSGASKLTHKFITDETWNAISGLSSEQIKTIHVSTEELTSGRILIKVDGVKKNDIGSSIADTSFIIHPSSSVEVISTSNSFDIPTAVFLQSLDVSAQNSQTNGTFFKPDGLKMYTTGGSGDLISEYDLSTPWDISTAVFLQSLFVGAQSTSPSGIFFKPDGLKMYTTDSNTDDVHEYDLSTPWDISTAVFLQSLDVNAQDISPSGIFFKPDGLKMYVTGNANDSIFEYDLSTPWDISTAVFLQSLDVSAQDTQTEGLFFKPDGLKMYTTGTINDSIFEYDLSTPWDISTAVFLQSLDVNAQDTSPSGIFFKPDGLKMYVTGDANDSIFEYDLSDIFTGTARVVIV